MLGATHETNEKKNAVKLSFALLQPFFTPRSRCTIASTRFPCLHSSAHSSEQRGVWWTFLWPWCWWRDGYPYSKHDVSLTPSMHGYGGVNIFLQMCSMASTRPIHLPGRAFSHCTQTVHTYIQYMHTGARYMCLHALWTVVKRREQEHMWNIFVYPHLAAWFFRHETVNFCCHCSCCLHIVHM